MSSPLGLTPLFNNGHVPSHVEAQLAPEQLSSLWNYGDAPNLKTKSFSDDSFMFTRTAEATQHARVHGLQNLETYLLKTSRSTVR
jgi:hypothetical protein